MNSTHAHITAGAIAAGARSRVQQGLGYGWPTTSASAFATPCMNSDVFMAATGNKRQPRRLGQRST